MTCLSTLASDFDENQTEWAGKISAADLAFDHDASSDAYDDLAEEIADAILSDDGILNDLKQDLSIPIRDMLTRRAALRRAVTTDASLSLPQQLEKALFWGWADPITVWCRHRGITLRELRSRAGITTRRFNNDGYAAMSKILNVPVELLNFS
jgi:hypothetical protein